MPNKPTQDSIRQFVGAVAFAALIGVGAWISLPVGPVPITLQGFFVYLAALLLRPRFALLSTTLYVIMGLIGLPVYASGGSGLAVLIGPTGGYLLGFILGATAASLVAHSAPLSPASSRARRLLTFFIALLICSAMIHSVGATWGKYQTNLGWKVVFLTWVLPFLPVDGVKILVAPFIADEIRRRRILASS